MSYEGFVLDVEANGLVFDSTKMWTLVCTDFNDKSKRLVLNPFKDKDAKQKLFDWVSGYDNPVIAFHYGLGYDIFALLNLLDCEHTVGPDTFMDLPVQFLDTYYLSMFLNPDRPAHSIAYFGDVLGLPKIDWRSKAIDLGLIKASDPEGAEFMQHHPEMDVYCIRDTDVNILVLEYLWSEWGSVYEEAFSFTQAFKCGQKSFYLMSCQELAGWKFDINLAKQLETKIAEMMEEIRAEVEPQLPQRALKKSEEKDYTFPAKPFKKSGELSATMLKFIEKHSAKMLTNGNILVYNKEYEIQPGAVLDVTKPMEMANQDQMKDWFISQGWEPTLWNYKKGEDGKPVRCPITKELMKTSPKMQETGKLCPNLEAMEGPLVKQVVKWLSLRNRQSVLQGWMNNPRLAMDGRIGASRSGIAATHRQRHSTVVNVPKASDKVLLGHEFRSLWIAEEGFSIAAADAAALEGRVQGHYTWRYDNGATAKELLDGDIHSKNVVAFYSSVYDYVTSVYKSPDFDKDNPVWKPHRDKSKNGFYCILYGGGAPKVASTLGISEEHGMSALEAFWDANPGTKALKDNLEKYWMKAGKKKYLPAIDGRQLCTRKKSALLNTIFQSCGGIAMDYAGCKMDSMLGKIYWEDRKPYYLYKGYKVRRIGYFHDEYEYEAEDPIAEEVGEMVVKSIAWAGKFLKLNVPLAGEAKIGKSWKETH